MRSLAPLFLLVPAVISFDSDARDNHAEARARMVAEVVAMALEAGGETGRPRLSGAVVSALAKVPRHRFVPAAEIPFAYDNRPLPIGDGQTISQPFIVALMSDLLEPGPTDRVLEVGTGSGYQAAILAELVARVYTIEIVDALARRASRVLADLHYRNVEVRSGDGYHGWPEAAPFDAVIVTAAPSAIPQPLIDQLKVGGRLVVPVGGTHEVQHLMLAVKGADGGITTRRKLAVRFVPLTRLPDSGRPPLSRDPL